MIYPLEVSLYKFFTKGMRKKEIENLVIVSTLHSYMVKINNKDIYKENIEFIFFKKKKNTCLL